jgi:hypothetical protein
MMHGREKSDSAIVAGKPTNKAVPTAAVQGRPKGSKTDRTKAVAVELALTGSTPLEVLMQAMRYHEVACGGNKAYYFVPCMAANGSSTGLKAALARLEWSSPNLVACATKSAYAVLAYSVWI